MEVSRQLLERVSQTCMFTLASSDYEQLRALLAQPATAKVEERAEFEDWHAKRYPLHSMLLDFDEACGEYAYPSRREMFDVWLARANLEIK